MAANGSITESLLAAIQARVIHGFSLDRLAAGAEGALIILDCQPGSGRFGYQLVHRLAARCERLGAGIPFVYVMAGDEPAVARWQSHPWLERLWARNLLDFARAEDPLGRDAPLVLERAGLEISGHARAASLVILANQVFSRDVPDLYQVERGRLYRCTPDPDAEGADGAYRLQALTDTAVYENETWNQILAGYAGRLEHGSFSLCPRALRWVERMHRISHHGMLLCADRGHVHEESLDSRSLLPASHDRDGPGAGPRLHDLNFNALAELSVRMGGAVLIPAQPAVHHTTVAFLCGDHPAPPRETVRAYHDAVAELSAPDDWLALEPLVEPSLARASAEQLCAYVRMSGWDDRALARCMPHVLARVQAGQVSVDTGLAIRRMVEEVWSHHVPEVGMGAGPDREAPDTDLSFSLGVLLFGLAYHEHAMSFFEHSLEIHGQSAAVHYNLALCAVQLGRRGHALEYLDVALTLEPDFAAARDLRLRITARM